MYISCGKIGNRLLKLQHNKSVRVPVVRICWRRSDGANGSEGL